MLLKIWFVVGVFTLGIFVAPVLADDIDCRKSTDQCPPSADCRCDLATPVQLTGSATASEGTSYTASGGRPSYRYEIGAGAINPETGVVTDVPQCGQSTTVSVTDACGQQGQMAVEIGFSTLSIGGPEDVVVGSAFGASGGRAPYTWSFGGGSIDSGGQITAINDCSGTGSLGWATVTVTDSCSQSASIEVRLPGGAWRVIDTEDFPEHTCPGQATHSLSTYTGRYYYSESYQCGVFNYTTAPHPAYNIFTEGCTATAPRVDTYTAPLPGANSFGKVFAPRVTSEGTDDDQCYHYDFGGYEVPVRTYHRITYEWQCP